MNRSCLVRTLQRPRAGLRKGARRSVSASSGIGLAAQTPPPPPPEDEDNVDREIAILKKLDHPNVVKLYEVRGTVLWRSTQHHRSLINI